MQLNTERLVQKIKENKMTQKELAERAGLTQASVTRYVQGQREPRMSNLMEMARVLCTTPEFLMGFDADHISSEETYKRVVWNIRSNCKRWTTAQKRELIILLSVYL